MPSIIRIVLTISLVAAICLTATAAARRPDDQWIFFHFDGKDFVPGRASDGSPSVALQTGMQPIVQVKGALVGVPLPKGTGAIVGVCFTEASGGKLKAVRPRSVLYPQLPVEIRSGSRLVLSTQTDEQGFFQAVLPAGTYQVSSRRGNVEVNVASGVTTMISLRVGKRMVD